MSIHCGFHRSGKDRVRCVLRIHFLLAGLLVSLLCRSQNGGDPFEVPRYDFIRYDLNRFLFPGDSMAYMHFLEKYSRLVARGEGQLSVVHIGGSHLQADIYSERIRSRFQTLEQGDNGGRGFIFPYRVAGTNNPSNFSVSFTGRWESCRNVQTTRDCILGLSGISVTTADSGATIVITFPGQRAVDYDFNRVRVFYLDDPLSFECALSTAAVTHRMEKAGGMTTWYLDSYTDSLKLTFVRTHPSQDRFTLLGISLETDDPGVIYHAVGVNGAKIPSFLRCSLLPEQLAALAPDMVVLSLGTNDAYTRYFNAEAYRQNYDTLVREIRRVLPDAAIFLTVPNDSYLFRRSVNRNTEKVREAIMDLGKELDLGVWDFYSIMGGLNSIVAWQRFGLAQRDRIHFTREGYVLIGDLFFNAFLKSYDSYIDRVTVY